MYRASFKYGAHPCRSSSKKDSFLFSAIRPHTLYHFRKASNLKYAPPRDQSEIRSPDFVSAERPDDGSQSQKRSKRDPGSGFAPGQKNARQRCQAANDRARAERENDRLPSKKPSDGRRQLHIAEAHRFPGNDD